MGVSPVDVARPRAFSRFSVKPEAFKTRASKSTMLAAAFAFGCFKAGSSFLASQDDDSNSKNDHAGHPVVAIPSIGDGKRSPPRSPDGRRSPTRTSPIRRSPIRRHAGNTVGDFDT